MYKDKIIPVVTLKNVEERTEVLNALSKNGIYCAVNYTIKCNTF